jgi:hypothetical protein
VVTTGGGAGAGGVANANGGGGAGGTAGPLIDHHNVVAGSAGAPGLFDGTVGLLGACGTNVGGRGGLGGTNGVPGGNGGGGGGGWCAGGGGGGGASWGGGGLVDPGSSGGGGGGAGSNCLGHPLFDSTCAGFVTPITSTNRAQDNFSVGNENGQITIAYPLITISSPAPSSTFQKDADADASFICAPSGSTTDDPRPAACSATVTKPDGSTEAVQVRPGITHLDGSIPMNQLPGTSLPTGAVGGYTMTVTAVDGRGGTTQTTRAYTVTLTQPTPAPPANVFPPTIAGTPVVGQTLTASFGSWTGPTGFFLYHYQWQRCNAGSCVDIADAVGDQSAGSTTRVVTPADRGSGAVGNTLRLRVSITTALGTASATSSETQPVKAAPQLAGGTSVVIQGVLKEGETLSRGVQPILPVYSDYELHNQWYRCPPEGPGGCEPIVGATGSTYTLGSAARGAGLGAPLQVNN